MKSSATNYGTPFSYAVTGEDNELLLYNYKDFHVYINGGNRLVWHKSETNEGLASTSEDNCI